MSFLKRLFGIEHQEPASASLAKERLKILISHERIQNKTPDFLPELKREIIAVISKYVSIDPEQIQIAMDCAGDSSSLELNFTIPDSTSVLKKALGVPPLNTSSSKKKQTASETA
jgi:cell division topological specificity factor